MVTSYLHFCKGIEHYPIVVWFTTSILASLLIWLCHYVSVFLTVGSMVVINLRVLGLAGKRQTLTHIAEIYGPWMWIGVIVLIVTGLLMLAGDSALFCTNGVFGINLLVTLLAVLTGVVINRFASSWDKPSGIPAGAKVFAMVSLLLWLGTILSAVEVPSRSNVP
jgi:hypothetical protein